MTDPLPEPFYEAVTSRAVERRLLLLAYHFPPAQTAGALRWQKLSHFAAERGFALDVITREPAQLAVADPSRLADLAPGTRVFGVPDEEHWILPPERAARAFVDRALRFLPNAASEDARKAAHQGRTPLWIPREALRWVPRSPRDLLRLYGSWVFHAGESVWAPRAGSLGMMLSSRHAYAAVISCGPPHMPHEAARRIGRARKIPFVMDLRDPWSLLADLNRYFASPLWYTIAERYERRAVRDAALVVMNTEPARDAMRRLYPGASDRIIAVMNGCDDEPIPPSRHGRRFTIAYAGSMYMNRDPRLLFRAARRVIDELSLTPEQFGFAFLGNAETYGGPPVTQLAQEEGISSFVWSGPARPRASALEFLADAPMLVNLPQAARLCIPSKVFEYMRFSAWVLALEPRDTATEVILRGTGADVAMPEDVDAIAAVLRRRYLEFAAGVRPSPIVSNRRYSRRQQARVLFDAMASIPPRRRSATSRRRARDRG